MGDQGLGMFAPHTGHIYILTALSRCKYTHLLYCTYSSVTRRKFRSTRPLDGVDIPLGELGVASDPPITVSEMMRRTVTKIPNHSALRYKINNSWETITYREYYNLCISAAKSFLKVQ